MLVLGLGSLGRDAGSQLAGLLEGPLQRPVLIVRPAADMDRAT